ncbi:MAG: DUF2249 domain-containing protein [Actinomyces sp.]|nr:DUF2249 domain-containing protein [Actinomyces sp.]
MTDRQMFKLVDANTVPSKDGGCGCGCGGEGKKARAEQAPVEQAPEQGGCGCGGHGHGAEAAEAPAEQAPEQGGCGCGGHGHAADAPAEQAPAEHAGCGCGGHDAPAERPHEMAAEPIASTAGGCGCGDGAPSAGNVHAGGAGVIHRPGADELVIHSIPRVVRHAVLFAAVDNLPVGENIQICAPHQPEPLFAHLQDSEHHYRVETLEVGPVDWRYRITRLA